jgi:hypothetical protein
MLHAGWGRVVHCKVWDGFTSLLTPPLHLRPSLLQQQHPALDGPAASTGTINATIEPFGDFGHYREYATFILDRSCNTAALSESLIRSPFSFIQLAVAVYGVVVQPCVVAFP